MTLSSATGGSPVTSYNLQWNRGDGSGLFTDLVGQDGSNYLRTSYLLVAGVNSGTTYTFRLRARNKWGLGGYSDTVDIEASTTPGQVASPTTSISGSHVLITWTEPANYGSAISAYRIQIMTGLGAYEEETNYCDGSQ
jgi:hypothetical protein